MATPAVQRVSECFINPLHSTQESNQVCYLTHWDISMLSVHYIQKGLLFKKPTPTPLLNQQDFIHNLLDNLKKSLSLTLFHFYPLLGRFVTQKTHDPPSYAIFVDCNNSPGVRFIHATLNMTIFDILSPVHVPPIVHSFFDHHKAVNHDGHSMPLLSIQVTELVDGVFIGTSMNHAVCDGTCYWHFLNTWSKIFQAQAQGQEYVLPVSHQPIHNRWLPDGCGPLINLPFKHHDEFIDRFEAPKLRERIFHFSAESIAKLKAKANSESNTTKISSFQSLSAHVWRAITRARAVPYNERTKCILTANNRTRMEPPLPREYFGNSTYGVSVETTAGELLEHDLGWAALKLNLAIANHDDKAIRHTVKEWLQCPVVAQTRLRYNQYSVLVSSSPRFDMYGNEFGMGKPVAVLSGYANKFDGKVTSFQGYEGGGSIAFEVCLLPETMCAMESDIEFMSAVSTAKPNGLC